MSAAPADGIRAQGEGCIRVAFEATSPGAIESMSQEKPQSCFFAVLPAALNGDSCCAVRHGPGAGKHLVKKPHALWEWAVSIRFTRQTYFSR
jgi:hypothetical protein